MSSGFTGLILLKIAKGETAVKKLLAVDYDNTLFQNGEIAKDTLNEIRKFRDDGNLFGIVSGRDYVTGYKTFRAENLFEFDFLLLKTGAMAVDVDGNVIYDDTFDGGMPWGEGTLASEVIRLSFEMGAPFVTTSAGKDRRYYYSQYPNGMEREIRQPRPHSEIAVIGDIGMMSTICKDEESATLITEKLKREFGTVLNPLQNGIAIDISKAGVDKGTGIQKFAEYTGISFENIWVAGDNYNDIAMLEMFHSCAMTNGVAEAKNKAEYVCDTVGDVIRIIREKSTV